MKRFALIAGIAALALSFAACPTGYVGGGAAVSPPSVFPPRPADPPGHIGDAPSLGYIWAGHFPLGNIVAYQHHRRHSDITEVLFGGGATTAQQAYNRGHLLRRHFAILTAEDEMKPDFLRPGWAPSWVWNRADNILDFAETHGMRMHGHALAWHSQTPNWLFVYGDRNRRDEAIANLQDYIETVMRHFGPRVESWDVLNEVFQSWFGDPVNAANWRSFLRGQPGRGTSNWFSSIGSEPYPGVCFIWIAFTTARRVADEIDRAAGRPVGTMILYYNDYNEEAPSKRDAIYFMVREMNQRFAAMSGNEGRLLIDAIGMQAHYHRGEVDGVVTESYRHATHVPNVRLALERFASLIDQGLLRYVSITELDVTVGYTGNPAGNNVNVRPPGTPLTANQEREQAIMYAQLFQIFRDNARHIRRVSFWGIDDPGSWRHRGSPHLWDGELRPKEAFWAVANPEAFLNPATREAYLANPRDFIDDRYW